MGKKSFHLLWIGQTMANAGDILYIVGLISAIYIVTGSAIYMAFLPFFNMTARFLSALLAPLLMDRFRLERLLAFSQIGKTGVLFVLSLFLMSFFNEETIAILFVFVVMIAFLDGWASPARDALLPRIVEKHELVKANSFMAVIDRSIQLGMWPLGAIVVSVIGANEVVWLTFILYGVAAGMMLLLAKEIGLIKSEEQLDPAQKRFAGFKEGWETIWKTPFLLLVSVTELIETNAGVVWIAAIMYVYVAEVLQTGEQWWGYINSSFFAGLLIGGILGLKYEHLIEAEMKRLILAGAVLNAVIVLMFGLIEQPLMALFLSAIFGFCSQLKGVGIQTLVQLNVRERLLPKVYSAQEAAYFGTFGLSTLGFGYLTDLYGAQFVFLLSAGLFVLSALLLVVYRNKLESKRPIHQLEPKDQSSF